MDESSQAHNRRQRRSNVLMAAVLVHEGRELNVKLRNLSATGALVEGPALPEDGAAIRFRRNDLVVSGKMVWVSGNRAGLHFDVELSPEALLRHVPTPKPRTVQDFRRPGLQTQPLRASERLLAATWISARVRDLPGE